MAYPYDEYANVWYASIKSDRWAHCVLNYPNVKREEIGCWPRGDELDGKIPNIKAIFWQGSDWFNQLTNINKEIEAIKKLELVVCMDSTITPSGLWADVLFPIATHFERHDVALPWYKGHYYIHRPKVIEPMGESKTDFQVFTELAYDRARRSRISASATTRRPTRDYFKNDDAVDEAYLTAWWETRCRTTRASPCRGRSSRSAASTSSSSTSRMSPSEDQIEKGVPFADAVGQDRNPVRPRWPTSPTGPRPQYGYEIPYIPKWIEPWESLNSPKTKEFPFHLITPHPRWRTHSIFNNIPWLRETYEQEVTINASRCSKARHQDRRHVEVWNERGKVRRAGLRHRALHAGCRGAARRSLDGPRRERRRPGRQPGLPDPRRAEPGRRLRLQHRALVDIKKTDLEHRPGLGQAGDLALARSSGATK